MTKAVIYSLLFSQTVVLGVALEWTVPNYYILSAIVHAILIPGGLRLMQVDPEHNSLVGGIIVAVLINVAAYFLREAGVFGVLIVTGTIFGLTAAVTSGEILKALIIDG